MKMFHSNLIFVEWGYDNPKQTKHNTRDEVTPTRRITDNPWDAEARLWQNGSFTTPAEQPIGDTRRVPRDCRPITAAHSCSHLHSFPGISYSVVHGISWTWSVGSSTCLHLHRFALRQLLEEQTSLNFTKGAKKDRQNFNSVSDREKWVRCGAQPTVKLYGMDLCVLRDYWRVMCCVNSNTDPDWHSAAILSVTHFPTRCHQINISQTALSRIVCLQKLDFGLYTVIE